jgi:hypothetical protein
MDVERSSHCLIWGTVPNFCNIGTEETKKSAYHVCQSPHKYIKSESPEYEMTVTFINTKTEFAVAPQFGYYSFVKQQWYI